MRSLSLTFLLLLSLFAQAQNPPSAAPKISRPKAVVGIVVDQMRWDYLYRYYPRYKAGGFRRLLGEGFSCDQTFINYLPTYTGPGHACVWTGSVPALHGIAGNEWIESTTGRYTYCVEDTTVVTIGAKGRAGMMSPRNLLTSTIGDELRLATNKASRVFAVSLKDRASVLPGGHMANGAYWYDNTGAFITSSYYRQDLPQWLLAFNGRRLPDTLLAQNWNLMYPAATYTQSTADSTPYEGKFSGGTITFPHNTAQYLGKNYGVVRALPAGNTLMVELAKAIILGEQIGKRGETDMLAVSFSSTDYVGHQFGPNSIEVEDCYLRLDADLARLLAFLDQQYGKNNYLVFLTADHGGAHNAQFLLDEKIPAGILYDTASRRTLNEVFAQRAHVDSINVIRMLENYQVYFESKRDVNSPRGTAADERGAVQEWLEKQPWVAYTWSRHFTNASIIPEPILSMILNGYHEGRSGDIQIIPKTGWYAGYGSTGTTHGTWNPYDSHIPLVWYGWGVKQGHSNRRTHMTDIAATLAAMLHIQMPNGCVGEVITEVAR